MTATTADSARGPGSGRPAGLSSFAADRAFIAGSALLFAACAVATVRWCWLTSPRMPMPGGGSLAGAAAFVSVWAVMMVAMMLPSLAPAFLGYRRLLREAHARRVGTPTVLAGVGYFLVWAGAGVVAYLLSLGLMTAEMRWPALRPLAPRAGSLALLAGGAVQLTAWKARQLERCRLGLLWCALLSVLRRVHVGAAGIRNDGSRRGRRDHRAHHSGACCGEAGSRGASCRHPPPRRGRDRRRCVSLQLGRGPETPTLPVT